MMLVLLSLLIFQEFGGFICVANTIEGWTYDRGTSSDCDGNASGNGECGPEYWGNLAGAESCGSDTSQSPINLAQATITNTLPELHFDFDSGCSSWIQGANDHNYNIKFAPDCLNLTLTLDEERFYLDSLHFHSPSEHTIGGGSFAAEAHLLHYSFTTENIIYVSILLDENARNLPYTNNSFLNSIWQYQTVPDIAIGGTVTSEQPINPYEDMFPGTYSHFNYIGSLTTPPCTPGATWFIFDTPVPISSDDVDILRSSIATVSESKMSQVGNTNRPVQAKNNRPLYYSYGFNSKSAIVIDQNFCDCDDTATTAKYVSIVSCGVALLTLVVLWLIYHKSLKLNDLEKRFQGLELQTPSNANPLQATDL